MVKFRDIPKYIGIQSSYSVDVDWNSLNSWLNRQLNSKLSKLDLNPDFQRGHVWSKEQQIKYVEYILKGGLSGKNLYFNHPGWMNNFKGHYVIIDGLQRLTAVTLFLKNEITAFNNYFKDYEDRIPSHASFIINIYSLKSRCDVLRWYIELNEGGVVHTDEELQRVNELLKRELKDV